MIVLFHTLLNLCKAFRLLVVSGDNATESGESETEYSNFFLLQKFHFWQHFCIKSSRYVFYISI